MVSPMSSELKQNKGVTVNILTGSDYGSSGSDSETLEDLKTWDRARNCWVNCRGVRIWSNEKSEKPIENVTHIKAPFLKERAQLDALTSINGLSIEEIERRARPGRYAASGFIGAQESFKEVLKKDWDTVEKLNVTHAELALHLNNIITIARRAENSAKDPVIEYRTKDLEGNTIFSEAPQVLEVSLAMTKGYQYDIFGPDEDDKREVDTPDNWSEEYTITNKSNGVKVPINSGVLSYIREFGFYEGGGDANKYRVDPVKVMAILTGK